MRKIKFGWLVRAANVIAPLILAAAGIVVAIRFNNSGDQWLASLIGWIAGWFFVLVAIAGWEMALGRPVLGRPAAGQPGWRRPEVIALAVVLIVAGVILTRL